ncbi:MAG: FHA domain-containing protein [Bacteroidales bacterium]|nr:FHA domain-containing protein [Bacteroidales bacterium]
MKSVGGNVNSSKTVVFSNEGEDQQATSVYPDGATNGKTVMHVGGNAGGSYTPVSHTVFGDDETLVEGAATGTCGPVSDNVFRNARKMVGWLVSYSLDVMGIDFKLYEGRNIIGRDMDCSITINDNMVSGKHAVLLYRAGKYSITDMQSSHGTFVNEEDIELEPRYLQDGDTIRMGKTTMKFRTSL